MILIMVLVLLLAGCTSQELEVPAEVVDFLDDTVFTVGTGRVSLCKWQLYALPEYDEIENLYGKRIWDYTVDIDGKTMSDAVKEDVKKKITYIEIVASKAEEMGMTLTEDDYIDINIRTADYMNRLSEEQKTKYGITQEEVEGIYAENMLAMKVYENLTLNVDTSTTEKEVRNMVLQYIPIFKYSEDDNEEKVMYSQEECEELRKQAEEFLDSVKSNSDITRLDELNDEKYVPITITADYSTLVDKLSEKVADIAFAMEEGEIDGIYECDDAYFILDCVEPRNEEATNAARIRIIEERQKNLFAQVYETWQEEVIVKVNKAVWDTL